MKSLLRRNVVRNVFLVYFALLMVQLWFYALWLVGRSNLQVARPNAVAGIIPFGAYLSFFGWVKSGQWDAVLPAGLVIIIAALIMSVLLKRGFCGWICPVGACFQIPADIGKRLRKGRDLKVARWVDLTLRTIRYVFAAALMILLAGLSVELAVGFRTNAFYYVADIQIVKYFAHPPLWWAGAGLVIVGLSVAYGNVWCRWLCPLGGVYGALGVLSVTNVCRDEDSCTRCGKCARACPNRVPVNKLAVVRAPECDGCQTCVGVCPEPGALESRIAGRLPMPWWVWPVAALVLWLGIYAIAYLTHNWASPLPDEAFRQALQGYSL